MDSTNGKTSLILLLKVINLFFSIIIPTYNEMNNHYFKQTLDNFLSYPSKEVEIIIVDSSSSDGTKCLLGKYPYRVIQTHEKSRAARLNIGVSVARGQFTLLHHPRSILNKSALDICRSQLDFNASYCWGGFTLKHDHPHKFLRFVSWYSNEVRVRRKKIVYLDHCIFISLDLAKKVFPIKDVEIFEDTIISEKLATFSDPILIKSQSLTSSIRFNTRGVLKQFFLNQFLKLLFKCGFSDRFMNKIYESNCHLNVTNL